MDGEKRRGGGPPSPYLGAVLQVLAVLVLLGHPLALTLEHLGGPGRGKEKGNGFMLGRAIRFNTLAKDVLSRLTCRKGSQDG